MSGLRAPSQLKGSLEPLDPALRLPGIPISCRTPPGMQGSQLTGGDEDQGGASSLTPARDVPSSVSWKICWFPILPSWGPDLSGFLLLQGPGPPLAFRLVSGQSRGSQKQPVPDMLEAQGPWPPLPWRDPVGGSSGDRRVKTSRVSLRSPAPFSSLHAAHTPFSPVSPPPGSSKPRVLGGAPSFSGGEPLAAATPARLLTDSAGKPGPEGRAGPFSSVTFHKNTSSWKGYLKITSRLGAGLAPGGRGGSDPDAPASPGLWPADAPVYSPHT